MAVFDGVQRHHGHIYTRKGYSLSDKLSDNEGKGSMSQ